MTAISAPAVGGAVTSSRQAVAVALLSWREARRMLTSPVYLLIAGGLLIAGARVRFSVNATLAYDLITVLLLYGPLFTLFAVNLVATSGARSGASAQLDAAPLDPQVQTLAMGLGVLLGPAALGSLLTVGLAVVDGVFDPKVAGGFSGWEYVQLPLLWLGAGLLGLVVARWLPWPGMSLVAFVAVIAWTVWSATLLETGDSAGFLMPFVISVQDGFGMGTGSSLGHLGWHTVYLLGLCLLALAAALLHHRPLRQRPVLGFALLATVLTVSAGWLQLP